jgi:hypothetical protein
MKLIQATMFVFAVAACSGLLGASAGYVVGRYYPSYYTSLYYRPGGPALDTVEIGVGTGFGEGLVLGAVLAVVLVLIQAWQTSRVAARKELDELRREVQELRQLILIVRGEDEERRHKNSRSAPLQEEGVQTKAP